MLLVFARAAGGFGLGPVGRTPVWWNVVAVAGAIACVPLQSAIESSLVIAALIDVSSSIVVPIMYLVCGIALYVVAAAVKRRRRSRLDEAGIE